jgi:hypothetical protein
MGFPVTVILGTVSGNTNCQICTQYSPLPNLATLTIIVQNGDQHTLPAKFWSTDEQQQLLLLLLLKLPLVYENCPSVMRARVNPCWVGINFWTYQSSGTGTGSFLKLSYPPGYWHSIFFLKNYINVVLVLESKADFCLVRGWYIPGLKIGTAPVYETGITSSPYQAHISTRMVLPQVSIRKVLVWGWYCFGSF